MVHGGASMAASAVMGESEGEEGRVSCERGEGPGGLGRFQARRIGVGRKQEVEAGGGFASCACATPSSSWQRKETTGAWLWWAGPCQVSTR